MEKRVIMEDFICPCSSEIMYSLCCKKYHEGKENAETPRELVKSRFSAYALSLADYIISTTHKTSPIYSQNIDEWKELILDFSKSTIFKKLEIYNVEEENNRARVFFTAHLEQNEYDSTFTEISNFINENSRWYYIKGQVIPGAVTYHELKDKGFI
jgi:SEC-C motif domain protein